MKILNPQQCTEPELADCVRIVHSDSAAALIPALRTGFEKFANDPKTRKTHLFNGRYENIYIDRQQLPELGLLLAEALDHAGRLLGQAGLRAGCWFNHMTPGAITTAHDHDDEDELLSGTYYVRVPEDSGLLVLRRGDEQVSIRPVPGMFVFFSPRLRHEVTLNRSSQSRLSIGMNFGLERYPV